MRAHVMEARYSSLRLEQALHRRCDYARACEELATLLKLAYDIAPKSLQAALFRDVLAAFRILQDRLWCSSADFSAANALLQASDSVLPKHKKSVVAAEFRKAAILLQRSSKHDNEQYEFGHLPVDILVHVFNHLDPASLANAACVCRSWNAGYKEVRVWQSMFNVIVDNTNFDFSKVLLAAGFELWNNESRTSHRMRFKDISIKTEGSWKKAFDLAISPSPKLLYLFTRARCAMCKATFWPSELCLQTFVNQCSKKRLQKHKLRPFMPEQVLGFVLVGSTQIYSTVNDNDSDGDEDLPYARLWEYAKSLR